MTSILLWGLVAGALRAATVTTDLHYRAESLRGALVAQSQTPRVIGMGGAFSAVTGDVGSITVNPAGLGRVTSPSGAAMYGLLGNETGMSVLAGAMPLVGGTLGVHLAALMYGTYDLRDASGVKTGSASAMDLAVTLAAGRDNPAWFLGRGSSGISLEAVSDAAGGVTLGLGVGAVVPVDERLTLGVAVQHLGPGREGASLPRTIRLGGSYALLEGALCPAADAGYLLVERRAFVALGAEYTPVGFATVRAGYRLDPSYQGLTGLTGVTAGAGFRYRGFGLDYAFQPFGDLASVHRVALVYGPSAAPGGPAAGATADAEVQAAATAYAAGDYAAGWARAYAALQLDPKHWQAWQMLGNCQYAKGDQAGATASYRRSLELHPDNPQLKSWLDQAK